MLSDAFHLFFYEYRPRTIEWEFETIIWSKMYRFNLCFNTLTYTIHTHTHTHTHTRTLNTIDMYGPESPFWYSHTDCLHGSILLSVTTARVRHRFTQTLVSHSICLFTYDIAYESIKALVIGSLDTSLTPGYTQCMRWWQIQKTESCRATTRNVRKLH